MVALCQLVQSTTYFLSRRSERVQLFVNFKLFSHLNGINKKIIGTVGRALLHFYHARLTQIRLTWRSLLPSAISSCLFGGVCSSSPFRIASQLHHVSAHARNHALAPLSAVTSYSVADVGIEQVAVNYHFLSPSRNPIAYFMLLNQN